MFITSATGKDPMANPLTAELNCPFCFADGSWMLAFDRRGIGYWKCLAGCGHKLFLRSGQALVMGHYYAHLVTKNVEKFRELAKEAAMNYLGSSSPRVLMQAPTASALAAVGVTDQTVMT